MDYSKSRMIRYDTIRWFNTRFKTDRKPPVNLAHERNMRNMRNTES